VLSYIVAARRREVWIRMTRIIVSLLFNVELTYATTFTAVVATMAVVAVAACRIHAHRASRIDLELPKSSNP
jgi:hypothetical protein